MLNSIIGWKCLVGAWSRIEGTAHDPNPNHPHALISNESLFHPDGHLIPSITVLGENGYCLFAEIDILLDDVKRLIMFDLT